MPQTEKWMEYGAKIQSAVIDMLQDENNSNYIDIKEFNDEENIKAFIHALATVVPANLFNQFTKLEKNHLEFNHVANALVFEYSKTK